MVSTKISFENVGALPKMEIKADGLTLIAGVNGTGKSTVLKSIYATTHAFVDFDKRKKASVIETINRAKSLIFFEQNGSGKITTNSRSSEFNLNTPDDVLMKELDTLIDLYKDDKDSRWLNLDIAKRVLSGDMDDQFAFQVIVDEMGSEFRAIEQFRSATAKDDTLLKIENDGRSLKLMMQDSKAMGYSGAILSFPQVVYYDTPFVLEMERNWSPSMHLDHRRALAELFYQDEDRSVIDKIAGDGAWNRLQDLIDEVVPGDFSVSSSKTYLEYREAGVVLRTDNIAAGMKPFGILKILLDKGKLPAGSLVLLDEPEVHLHPKWQNDLAELIVLLVKKAGVKVIMTTHSQQLALGIQVKAEEYDQHVDYYRLSKGEDGLVECADVTHSISKIYREMAEPFSVVANALWKDNTE